MALTSAALFGDLRLRKSRCNDLFDDFGPVHLPSITCVIDQCKHHRDLVSNHNKAMRKSLAERLSEKREALGLTQAGLAKLAKLRNQSIIGMLESGARKASSHIPAIAYALGVESLWLASGDGPEKRIDATQYTISETAMKIALAVNARPPEYQDAMLHLVTIDAIAEEGRTAIPLRANPQQRMRQ